MTININNAVPLIVGQPEHTISGYFNRNDKYVWECLLNWLSNKNFADSEGGTFLVN